jgi:membrane associated rhomboid family serine protease
MAIGTRDYARPYLAGGRLPLGVKFLLISNTLIFLLQYFTPSGSGLDVLFQHLALIPAEVIRRFFLWQLVTYLFLHGGVWHIVINMLTLWMFGKDLETTWGTRRFMRFYFFCGIGAGVCVVLANYLFGNPNIGTIGASGAIYGILLVSAVLWPDRIIIFYIFPIKLKYFVMIFGAIAFLGAANLSSGVSDVAHLSGMGFGYLFLKLPKSRGIDPFGWVNDSYRAWKLARAKRKFQVYLRKQRGSDQDPRIH